MRDYGTMNVGVWQDDDFRALPFPAQHLYMVLWNHPALSYCGVMDWRPNRLAQLSYGWTTEALRVFAQCLQARHFVVIDEDTEELFVRSYVRWDGLMKQPRLAVSYVKAFSEVASNMLRKVIIYELEKLQEFEPGLAGFKDSRVSELLAKPSVSAKVLPSVSDPFGEGFGPSLDLGLPIDLGLGLGQTLPNVSGRVSVPPTPAPAPTPSSIAPAAQAARPKQEPRGERLPADWEPNQKLVAEMRLECPHVDLDLELRKFHDYWHSESGAKAAKRDWARTWRNWIREASRRNQPRNGQQRTPQSGDPDYDVSKAWMHE